MKIRTCLVILFLLTLSVLRVQDTPTSIESIDQLKWEKVAPGIWKAALGEKEIAPMDYTGAPKIDATSLLGDPAFPLVQENIRGELVGNIETITIETPLDKIPLFVMDGGIIPMMPAVNNINSTEGPMALEIRHYGNKAGKYHLYDDDGGSYDFEKGIYSITNMEVISKKGKLSGKVLKAEGSWPTRYGQKQWVFMTQ